EYTIFPGFNCRMNEMIGAVLKVQLKKRDGLIEKMKGYSKRIREAIGEIPGVTMRRLNDPEGEIGICVMFFLESLKKVQEISTALRAEGIDPGTTEDSNVPDWHIYKYWDHILNRQGNNDSGFPFTLSDRTYSKDMCPKTIDFLERCIHIDVNSLMTDNDVDEIIEGLQKILTQLL
ncbi:MAG: DegT/DnrJ/EryC1/StrS family aminotransferase, partial [Clostridiales bacterium]|nr:DegT/DnrJ/EryC1/StrS family aminotransferase [Clostridiales bacterium]